MLGTGHYLWLGETVKSGGGHCFKFREWALQKNLEAQSGHRKKNS